MPLPTKPAMTIDFHLMSKRAAARLIARAAHWTKHRVLKSKHKVDRGTMNVIGSGES